MVQRSSGELHLLFVLSSTVEPNNEATALRHANHECRWVRHYSLARTRFCQQSRSAYISSCMPDREKLMTEG